jgi:hypothetical protein
MKETTHFDINNYNEHPHQNHNQAQKVFALTLSRIFCGIGHNSKI